MATEIKSTSIKSQNLIAEPVANKPASPEQGQIIQANGTGNIAKGIYQYSGASWVSLDNAQGDLETLRLIMSTDTDAVGFSSALNSTSTLAGNTNAVPHETSTGTGMLGALDIPSTGGDALLTEFDANKVFRYYSAGANNNNDYFGIPVDIPAQTRGQNIVIKFKYRTEEASAASSNGDFQVSVWDKSNGVSTTQASTLTTGTTISAGSNILMTAKTNLAVGDKIWFETGTAAVNNVANGFTQAYITSISSTDNNITVSEDVTVVASGIAVTGWLSDKVSGLLPSADSDTNKVGKDYSIAVKTEEDTEQVVVWFSNKSTTTNVIELFFDGILVSQNKFLQASSQTKSESYSLYSTTFWDNTGTMFEFDHSSLVAKGGSPPVAQSKLLRFEDSTSANPAHSTTAGTRIYAREDILISVGVMGSRSNTKELFIYDSTGSNALGVNYNNSGGNETHPVTLASYKLNKDDYISVGSNGLSARDGWINISATPEASPVVILESQDEIFTDWQDGGTLTFGAITTAPTKPTGLNKDQIWYRRNGSNGQFRYEYEQSNTTSATAGSGDYLLSLPAGLSFDLSKISAYSTSEGYGIWLTSVGIGGGAVGWSDASGYAMIVPYNATQFRVFIIRSSESSVWRDNYFPLTGWAADPNLSATLHFEAPIQGWNSNFNPLLSMPLVEIGNNSAVYSGNFNGANVGYGKYVNTVYEDTLSTSGLCAVTAGTSTTAFNLLAQQRVKVSLSMSNGQSSTNWYYGVVTGTASAVTDHTVSFSNAALDGYRITGSEIEGASGIYSQTAVCILEPGENLQVRTSNNGGTSYSGGINSLFHIVVEKDFSNTNMAHIIKPAVAIISDEYSSYGQWGGDVGAINTWNTRTLNTVRGESWFVTLNDSTDTFTLEAGTYKITGQAPLYAGDSHKIRLYNSSDSTVTVVGGNAYASNAYNGQSPALIYGTFTIGTSKNFIIQHIIKTDNGGISQGGFDSGGTNSGPSIFTIIMIEKLK